MINDSKIINNKERIEKEEIGSVIKGLMISLIVTLLFILGISFLLVSTSISESIIIPSIWVITALSLLIGTIIAIKKSGMLYGGIVGMIYISLLYTLSSIVNGNFSLTSDSIILIFVSIISGGLGGIIGVNLKRM